MRDPAVPGFKYALPFRPVPPGSRGWREALGALDYLVSQHCGLMTTRLNMLASAGRDDSLTDRPWTGEVAADIHWFDPWPHVLQFSERDGNVELVRDDRRTVPATRHTGQ